MKVLSRNMAYLASILDIGVLIRTPNGAVEDLDTLPGPALIPIYVDRPRLVVVKQLTCPLGQPEKL